MLSTEIEKAKAWRKARGLSVERLAELSGYSVHAIYSFECGRTTSRGARSITEWVWQRYKNCCAGIDAQLRSGTNFDWGH